MQFSVFYQFGKFLGHYFKNILSAPFFSPSPSRIAITLILDLFTIFQIYLSCIFYIFQNIEICFYCFLFSLFLFQFLGIPDNFQCGQKCVKTLNGITFLQREFTLDFGRYSNLELKLFKAGFSLSRACSTFACHQTHPRNRE